MPSTNTVLALADLGQSVWLDTLSRGLLEGGELARLIALGVTGVTSNPTIFEKAIAQGHDYDADIAALVEEGKGVQEIYDALTLEDVRRAADLLRPVYDRSDGRDGYASLEVSPLLAYDTAGTIQEARRLFYSLGRPNVMIKVPATAAGIPAIRDLIADGINVNVTLIFSRHTYRAVMEAYLEGLERRRSQGQAIDRVASVASFFVSRVDTLVDRLLAERGASQDLAGRAAVANAKLAYRDFRAVFASPRFQALAAAGAMIQRPLWASTGTKNPAYSDLLYVDNLIGPDTINTLPLPTLEALLDHGHPARTLDADLDEAARTLDRLEAAGIDLEAVAAQLLDEGVDQFAASYHALIRALGLQRSRVAHRLQADRYNLGSYEPAFRETLRRFAEEEVVSRLYRKDPALWSADPAVQAQVAGALGWLDVPAWSRQHLPAIRALARDLQREGYTDVVLMGMGGSSLVSDVLAHSFPDGALRLTVLDSTDPGWIRALAARLDPARTLFIVASKSGTTTEALAFYRYFWQRVRDAGLDPGPHFVAITDPGTPLEAEAGRQNFRRVFLNPVDIGGRYSALSLFGVVPGTLMGVDMEGLLGRAEEMRERCRLPDPATNPGVLLGVAMGVLARAGRDKVTLAFPSRMGIMADWIEQLLAESTGKNGTGFVPVAHEPLADPADYGDDRLFVTYRWLGHPDPDLESHLAALEALGHPVIRLTIADRYGLGAEFYRWEVATALGGRILGINAFDQPNVQESKDNTARMLAALAEEGQLPVPHPHASDALMTATVGYPPVPSGTRLTVTDALAHLLRLVQPGDYVALMAYLAPTAEHWSALEQLREVILRRWRVATTVGFGPRFLHSTGQLHKGGSDHGVFLQLVTPPAPEAPAVPGQPYDFASLITAQGLGDFEALTHHHRRVLRLTLTGDPTVGLAELARTVAALPLS
ncbi:Transaldolase [Candidatus Hydrogenisulfobacillus filiaventi]|uniref:Transaldolase n=1 Tax=Candidatus Hydrogenisulfobacillus filiaventi TaxID=2707344 RepID=A0A6F8ZF57_9FIRM|nr:bifunctional transaldolase/phosoglucose isomerase [Bacillota bacterium]CAB1128629.1 Transaldolase [Candidatus Hydrogenisulfobacillus filiaventi]